MTDDADQRESPNGEAPRVVDTIEPVDDLGTNGQPDAPGRGPVDIALVEIDLVELEVGESDPGAGPPSDVTVAEDDTDESLPTMADLDRVALELDHVDNRLAALDEQRS